MREEKKAVPMPTTVAGKPSLAFVISLAGLILMLVASLDAEAGWLSRSKAWKEEVLLHDGKVLIVERHSNPADYLVPGSSEPPARDESLAFTLPETNQRVTWKTEFDERVPEPNSLGPLLLDIVDGIPYLATSPAGCISYNKWGRPNPPYILFKYAHEKWERIPLQEFPQALVKPNLMGLPPLELLKPYYTVEQAQGWWQGGNMAEYARTVLREPVSDLWKGCPKLISYGKQGGWIGLDWFTDQPSLDACLKFCIRKNVSSETCPCNEIFKEK